MLSCRRLCASWISSDGRWNRYGRTIQPRPKALSQRRGIPESNQAVATIAERNGFARARRAASRSSPCFRMLTRPMRILPGTSGVRQALHSMITLHYQVLTPPQRTPNRSCRRLMGRCRRGRQLHGRHAGRWSCDRRTRASVPEAMTLRETRDRARAFPKVERIGPEAERKQQAQMGLAAMPASDGALSSGAWQAVHTNVPETGSRKEKVQ